MRYIPGTFGRALRTSLVIPSRSLLTSQASILLIVFWQHVSPPCRCKITVQEGETRRNQLNIPWLKMEDRHIFCILVYIVPLHDDPYWWSNKFPKKQDILNMGVLFMISRERATPSTSRYPILFHNFSRKLEITRQYSINFRRSTVQNLRNLFPKFFSGFYPFTGRNKLSWPKILNQF